MKQVLLGTTALIAAGLVSGQAMAQASKADPIKLELGGSVSFAGGDIVRENDGPNTGGFAHKNFQFKENITFGGLGETKLDNGLIVGANVSVRGQDAARTVSSQVSGITGAAINGTGFAQNDAAFQSFGFFKGAFGQLLFGDVRDATSQKAYEAPVAGQIFGQNSPLFLFSNNPVGTNSTIFDLGGIRSTNVSYFSPSFAGFSFGATYKPISAKSVGPGFNCAGSATPLGGTESYLGPVPGCTAFNNTLGAINDIVAIHINYDAKFGDFTVGVGGGASHGTKEKGLRAGQLVPGSTTAVSLVNSDADLNDYYASFNLIYGPYAVGGGWQRRTNVSFNGNNFDTFDVGGRYTIGPAAFSLGATRGYYKGFQVLGNTSNNLFTSGSATAGGAAVFDTTAAGFAAGPATFNPSATPTLTIVSAVANYQLGPGIALTGAVDYEIYHSHSPYIATSVASKNLETIAVLAGTRLNF